MERAPQHYLERSWSNLTQPDGDLVDAIKSGDVNRIRQHLTPAPRLSNIKSLAIIHSNMPFLVSRKSCDA